MSTVARLMERARQQFHLGDRTFKPTPNVRNPAMLQEAEEFARHMTTYKQLLAKYERQLASLLSTLPLMSRSNLPRVWEAIEGTSMCEPTTSEITSAHPNRMGGDYDEVLMVDAAEIMRRRVESILRPIERWIESLAVVKTRMARLERLRLQVDARRRRVHRRFLRALRNMSTGEAAAFQAQTELQALGRIGGIGGRASALGSAGEVRPAEPETEEQGTEVYGEEEEEEEEAEEVEDLESLRHKEDYAREAINQHRKLEAVAESYREQDQMVFEQLSGLVRDAAYFKSYVAASFLVFKDALQATLAALGPCKRPLPGFAEREPAERAVPYGRVADISDLIAALPPVVKAGGRHVPAGMRSPTMIAREQIRPKRVTAQPLQVAADDLSGVAARYAHVPAVTKPASQVPADQLQATPAEEYSSHYGEATSGYQTPASQTPATMPEPAYAFGTTDTSGFKPAFGGKGAAFRALHEQVAGAR